MAEQEQKPAIEYLGPTGLQQVVLPEQGTGHLVNCTFAAQPCGCKIVGNGTIPHPLDIERCAKHAAALDLLAACEMALADLFHIPAMEVPDATDRDRLITARSGLQAAIAKAKP